MGANYELQTTIYDLRFTIYDLRKPYSLSNQDTPLSCFPYSLISVNKGIRDEKEVTSSY